MNACETKKLLFIHFSQLINSSYLLGMSYVNLVTTTDRMKERELEKSYLKTYSSPGSARKQKQKHENSSLSYLKQLNTFLFR
jgi:hypothetical protein